MRRLLRIRVPASRLQSLGKSICQLCSICFYYQRLFSEFERFEYFLVSGRLVRLNFKRKFDVEGKLLIAECRSPLFNQLMPSIISEYFSCIKLILARRPLSRKHCLFIEDTWEHLSNIIA